MTSPLRTAALLIPLLAPLPGAAQETLERSPSLSGGWTGQTGMLYANLSTRLERIDGPAGRTLAAEPSVELALGLPFRLLAGGRWAAGSAAAPGTDWELYGRFAPLLQARGSPADGAVTLAWNGGVRALEGELSFARWLGPLRLLGGARLLGGHDAEPTRAAFAGGAVLHPLAGSVPVALAADGAVPSDRRPGERPAWSAGVQLGVSFTTHTLSAFATNATGASLRETSRGDDRVRFGLEITVPVPAGRFLGWVVPRDAAQDAVVERPDRVDELVRAEMARYLFLPKRIEIPPGTTVEWVNLDGVLHTVNAEDGGWRSGPIEPGGAWRARFDRPGRYLVYCGPHPFMKAEVIVR